MVRHRNFLPQDWRISELAMHALLAGAAVAAAFSLPLAMPPLVSDWWPHIAASPELLLWTESYLAVLLFLTFLRVKKGLEARDFVASARLASLVHASSKPGALARWRERLSDRQQRAEDACIMTVTGFDTFTREDSQFRAVLQAAREIHVMLLNPMSEGARLRADSLSGERDYYGKMLQEIHASLDWLAQLRAAGKRVVLRFYDHRPLWKLVVVGEYVWVQYCHEGMEVNAIPEYVFALHSGNPERGLFTPFSRLFAEAWARTPALEFDFDTGEMVQRDASGAELARLRLPRSPHASKTLAIARHSQCALTGYIPGEA